MNTSEGNLWLVYCLRIFGYLCKSSKETWNHARQKASSVVTAAFYWNMYCSVLLIAWIGVDRLLAIVYPMQSLTWRSPQAAVIACIIMWMLSFAGSIPLFTIHQTFYISELNITTCHDVHSTDKITWLKTYFLIICCVLFFLPLLITVVSYAQIIWSLSRLQYDVPETSHRKRRAVVMTLTVLLIFLLCFVPTNCLLLAHYLQFNTEKSQEAPDGSYALYLVFLCLGSLHCLLDPLLYYFGSSQCQKRLSNMVKCKSITQSRDINFFMEIQVWKKHLHQKGFFSIKPQKPKEEITTPLS
uniref:G-protein coupled receptors family 1 profile domain-containing protein n=1 Tax=Neolamprologus brichardi TaxID=32507 RepID=A0A3Q4HCK4_NEOBR